MKLKRTKEPVTWLADANQAPEPLRRLTWCYVALRRLNASLAVFFTLFASSAAAESWIVGSWQSDGAKTVAVNRAFSRLPTEEIRSQTVRNLSKTFWHFSKHDLRIDAAGQIIETTPVQYELIEQRDGTFVLSSHPGDDVVLIRSGDGFCVLASTPEQSHLDPGSLMCFKRIVART